MFVVIFGTLFTCSVSSLNINVVNGSRTFAGADLLNILSMWNYFSVLIKEHAVFCIWPCLLIDNHHNVMHDYCNHHLPAGNLSHLTLSGLPCFVVLLQSLFHLPVFRRLVLNYHLSERVLEKCKSHSVSKLLSPAPTPLLPFTADLIIQKLWRFSVNTNIAVMGECKGAEIWLRPFVNRTSGT